MTTETTKSIFWQGVRDGAPFVLVIVPFALLFGVVATEAGLNLVETMAFSVLVIAGAAQFTAVELLSKDAPAVIALVSALAVNLRMAMYSASLTPHLGAAPLWQRALAAYLTVDQTYACSILKYQNRPDWTARQKLGYFLAVAVPIVPLWYAFTLVGALVGSAMPAGLALDFAVPITFLAMVGPMLHTRAHLAAAVVSVTAALVFAFLPYNLGLLLAAVLAMMTGARVEVIEARRAARGEGA